MAVILARSPDSLGHRDHGLQDRGEEKGKGKDIFIPDLSQQVRSKRFASLKIWVLISEAALLKCCNTERQRL